MRTKRLLTLVVLLTVVLTLGLATAQAQDKSPTQADATHSASVPTEPYLNPDQALAMLKESEPNNQRTEESADWIYELGEFATPVSGVISSGTDVDYYTFYGIPGDQLEVRVWADQAGSDLDAELTLYDEAGEPLVYNDDCYAEDLDSCISYTITSEEFYYLLVTDLNGRGGASYGYDLFVWMPVRNNEWWYQYGPGDEEPNNTRGSAYAVRYGHTLPWTRIDVNGDVDYYKFTGQAGDQVRILVETRGLRGGLNSRLALYNSAGTLLGSCPQSGSPYNCFLEKVLPKAGTYFVKVSGAANDGGQPYWLQIGLWEVNENDDSVGAAKMEVYGNKVRGMVSAGDTCDYIRFYGEQHDYVTVQAPWMEVDMLDQNGNLLITNYMEQGLPMSMELPYTGIFYISVCAYYALDYSPLNASDYTLIFNEMMLTGIKTNGKVGSFSYGMGDIIALERHSIFPQYTMFFDGSDVGLKPKTNLMDFDVVQRDYYGADMPDYLLMAFKAAISLPGVANVAPHDIVKFVPYDLGEVTNGYWEMYLDGSDIGLTTTAETIDAVEFTSSEFDNLYFSTTGHATITPNKPGSVAFVAEDEDIVRCSVPQGGWNTVVGCSLFFDGSAAGIPAGADVSSFSHGSEMTDDLFFTFAQATTFNGTNFLPNEVVQCHPNNWTMPLSSCTWYINFDGFNHGLYGKVIDGLDTWMQPPY